MMYQAYLESIDACQWITFLADFVSAYKSEMGKTAQLANEFAARSVKP